MPHRAQHALRLFAVLSLVGAARAAVHTCLEGETDRVSQPGSGTVAVVGTQVPANCSFLLGGTGRSTQLWGLLSDSDPGFSHLTVYDAQTPDPTRVAIRLEGYEQTAFTREAPLISTSGFFFIVFEADALAYPGKGEWAAAANFTSSTQLAVSPPPPRPSSAGGTTATQVATSAAALQLAVDTPAVTDIVVSSAAPIRLTQQLEVLDAGRSLVIRCASPDRSQCLLDAGGASRHFAVRPGASLRLLGLTLVNGFAVQGGSVLAVNASFTAQGVLFANSTAIGDGGGVLGLGASLVTLENCAPAAQFPPARRLPVD